MGGSSKKVTVGYRYYLGMQMILTHGPADLLRRISVDSRTAWTGDSLGGRANIDAANLFGGESREGGISGAVDVEMGRPTQGRNDYLQSKINAAIPAFRGVVGVVLRQCYLGINPYLKKWSFRLQRVHVRQNGLSQWYGAKAAIASGYTYTLPPTLPTTLISATSAMEYKVVELSDAVNYSLPAAWGTAFDAGNGPFGDRTHLIPDDGWPSDPGTIIPVQKKVWLRKVITVDRSSPVLLEFKADNFLYVYWNGNPVTVNHPGSSPWTYSATVMPSGPDNHLVVLVEDQNFFEPSNYIYAGVKATQAGNESGVVPHLDMNPAHIVRECLTDPDWGMGYPEEDIDDASFAAAADTLFDEEMGISLLWDRQTSIEDFVKEIVRHINGALYVDRVTGKFVLKLIRKDYVEDDLITLGEDDIEKVDGYGRPTFGELLNSVTINYWDAATGKTASIQVDDAALVQMQGGVIGTTVQYPGFTNAVIASKAGQADLRAFSTPLLSATVYANRKASGLNIGSVFKFEWPDLHDGYVVMRVTGMALGDGRNNKVRLSCTEDAFAIPASAVVAAPASGWENPSVVPEPAVYRIVAEAPYYELVQRLGQTQTDELLASNPSAGYVLASAAQPTGAINATLLVDAGAGYEDSGVVEFCPVAFLSADVAPGDTTLPVTGGYALDEITVGSHAQLGAELVRIDAVTSSALTVGRGVLDTVPTAHLSGAVLLAWDVFAEGDSTEYSSGEELSVKLLPASGAGAVAASAATADVITLGQRAARPYPPGNVQINGEYFPVEIEGGAVTATWVHRDRVQQTAGLIADFLDGDIGPEVGTTYSARLVNATTDAEIEAFTGVTGTSQAFTPLTETTLVRLELFSVRDGLDSWQTFAHEFTCVVSIYLGTEAGDRLTTEAGDPLILE